MPTNELLTNDKIKAYKNNGKERNAILSHLTNLELVKVMSYKSTKYISKKMESIYEGDDKVKQVKIKNYKAKFENLRMSKDEDITA